MRRIPISTYELLRRAIVFTMLGTIMYVSDVMMDFLPNVHLVGALIMVYTVVYRAKALIPIYIYVFISGFYALCFGTVLWWLPYLYVWAVLWAIAMLLPQKMPPRVAVPVYMIVCALHGLGFGILYAPFQALAFGLSGKQILAWIAAGFPFDVIHAVGNFAAGSLILPLSQALTKMEKKFRKSNSHG